MTFPAPQRAWQPAPWRLGTARRLGHVVPRPHPLTPRTAPSHLPSVKELKQAIEAAKSLDASAMKLIQQGKIVQPDEATLSRVRATVTA